MVYPCIAGKVFKNRKFFVSLHKKHLLMNFMANQLIILIFFLTSRRTHDCAHPSEVSIFLTA